MAKVLPEIPAAVLELYAALVTSGAALLKVPMPPLNLSAKACLLSGPEYTLKKTTVAGTNFKLVVDVSYYTPYGGHVVYGDNTGWAKGDPMYWVALQVCLHDRSDDVFTATYYGDGRIEWMCSDQVMENTGHGFLMDLFCTTPDTTPGIAEGRDVLRAGCEEVTEKGEAVVEMRY